MSNIENTLNERGSTYGDFTDNARVSEGIMDGLRCEEGFQNLRPVHKAALNVIAQKMSRIVNGDPEYKDNWHDIEGYAKLAEDRCLGRSKADSDPFIGVDFAGTTDKGVTTSQVGINQPLLPNVIDDEDLPF